MVLLNFAMIALGFVCLYFLGLRSGSLVAVGMSFLFFVGIAQYFISQFKQSSILPSDLMALGTAMAVSDGYDFVFTDSSSRSFRGIPPPSSCLSWFRFVLGSSARGAIPWPSKARLAVFSALLLLTRL